MQTIGGPITWSSGDKTLNPVPNVCTTPHHRRPVGQGRPSTPTTSIVVNNSQAPEVPTQGELQPSHSTERP